MPVAVARPKRQVLSRSTGSHSIVTARPVFDPAPTTFCASSRSIPLIRPRRRAESTCAEAVSGSPASAAHIASTSWTMFAVGLLDAVLQAGKARRVGIRQRALHADLEHARREAVDVDAGHDHPRRVRFAHAQQQPGALGGPVDRVHVARSRAPRKQGIAQRDMRPARRDRRFHPAHQGGEEGAARAAPRVGAETEASCGIEPPDDARVAPGMTGYSTGGGGGSSSASASDSTCDRPVPLSPDAVGRAWPRRRGGLRRAQARRRRLRAARWAAPCPAQAPEGRSRRRPPPQAGG